MRLEETVAQLQRRVGELEDRLALMQLLATYGPAVDSGAAEPAAGLWTDDGVYDVDPEVLRGRAAIAGMVTGEGHQRLIRAGAAHLQGLPHLQVDGDRAVATAYSQLVLRDEATDGFRVWRTGVNRWEFTRTPGGWQVTHRTNRQLNGAAEARELLYQAVAPPSTG
ncbi:nuclear transport factor 2 family protein [Dactylosporangium sp. CS-047395]|uniref:nuclear transport factor 2 family protein n=1 Tax=Dactylosporangium sp. CS-047395 TaxID=3239936 RepID=UPI003D8CCA42